VKPGEFEVRHPKIEEMLRDIGHTIGDTMPKGWGFTLMLFEYDGEGLFYISSSTRDTMVKAMREFIAKFEEN
jgi:hypothetical protein